jgi:hypothetical protein
MATKKKVTGGNPQKHLKGESHPLARQLFNRIKEGVQLTKKFEAHVAPMGESLITLEQWRYMRGSVVADLALYAHLTGKPSPIDMILASEQQKVLIEIEEPV